MREDSKAPEAAFAQPLHSFCTAFPQPAHLVAAHRHQQVCASTARSKHSLHASFQPVLSEHTTVAVPIVSAALRWRTCEGGGARNEWGSNERGSNERGQE